MWLKKLGLGIGFAGLLPFIAFVICLFSALASQNKPWHYISWTVFGLSLLMLFISFFLIAPYKVWRRDMDKVQWLVNLKDGHLQDLQGNPNICLHVILKRISLLQTLGHSDGNACIELYVINKTILNLSNVSWRFKRAVLTIENDDTSKNRMVLCAMPIEANLREEIPAGAIVNMEIHQYLVQGILDNLRESIRNKRVKWEFRLFVSFTFDDGKRNTAEYLIEWEGIHDRIYCIGVNYQEGNEMREGGKLQ